ncbi:MAG: class I SAM-dependent methyltransferase [Anaerolineales bacterium]
MSNEIEPSRLPSSFRDPSGFVFTRRGKLYRRVSNSYRDEFDMLIDSGLYEELAESELMVKHTTAESESHDSDTYLIIAPEPVGFISYPYEWCFSQLKDAALVTLNIHERALNRTMSLKDASAYNIQFHQGKPLLIDTLSFERFDVSRPWVAYRQFCRHFLAPLALMAKRDPGLGLLARAYIDGVPLSLASRLLPWHTRLSFPLLTHIHLHASAERRFAGADPSGSRRIMSMSAHLGLIDNLRRAIERLSLPEKASAWESYDEFHQYGDAAFASKLETVTDYIKRGKPNTVWDLGANIGEFSRIASNQGSSTVAFDYDHGAVERNYAKVRQQQERHILPLVLDLTNPSPGLGWSHRERASLLDRGPADMVLALALVHHLAIGNNIPLQELAGFLADCGRWALVEFVPKEDPQVKKLLVSREDIFHDYSQEGFEHAFGMTFRLHDSQAIAGTDRVLYLMERQ